jgi:hypothetical protein
MNFGGDQNRNRWSRKTVRQVIDAPERSFADEREVRPMPTLAAHVTALQALLPANEKKPQGPGAAAGA